ncbi:MFS transporter [Botrimarina mediterranea]|uniref:Nucleoside transporter YegT n=1 Tax=Botrimarina mediterranea TaxID=2528022 RepID=A0A518K5U6_9BACT|nr:MFS transporter [Botrimarina mediterranea]QDV73162.1 Putative nucleoside transporter YegT [Botrimarina mediterranea]QDV77735.1 Putative nucleoside transporter YegT [Planctomycetes bacterium K2D]
MPDQLARRSSPGLLARLAAMMFVQYWALGIWYVTVWNFIAANTGDGALFTPGFVGYSASASAIGSLVAPTLCGWLADRFVSAKYLVAVLHVGAALALGGMYLATSQTAFFVGMIAYFQVYSPSVAVTNTIALRLLGDKDREFPVVRLFGTVGWMGAGVFVGVVCRWYMDASIEATRAPILMALGSHIVMSLWSLTLPDTPPVRPDATEPKPKGNLHRNRAFMLFLLVSLLAAIPSQAYNFAIIFLNQKGYLGPAAMLTMGQLTEAMCLFLMPFLLARWRLKALFLIGVLGWATRYTLLAIGSFGAPDSWAAYPVTFAILLHGPSYVFVYLAGQMYVDRLVHPTNRGAAQGLHALATGGIGHLLGAGLCGQMQATLLTPTGVTPPPYNWVPFWLIPVGIGLSVAILFALTFFERPHHGPVEPIAVEPSPLPEP